MKWLVLGLLACLARHGSGGAIKCLPSSTAPECAAEVKGLPVPKADIRQNIPQALVEITQDNSTMVTLPEVECLAGTEWESHCHSCQCSGFGIADCTRIKGCKEAQEANPIRCKPNTMFYRDCNSCICQESGLGLCTLMICAPVQPIQPVHDDCPPGTSWKIGCNTCTCVGDGRQLCTQMECTDKEGKPIPVRQGFDCAPETSWKVQCSSCTCSQDGHPLCSDLGCSNINAEPLWKCAPKSVWKNDCNECWCTETGQPICTRMACNSDFNSTNFFFDNKAQGKDEAQIEKESQEKSVATNKLGNEPNASLLRKVRAVSQDTPRKTCQPSLEFRMDCNKCLCDPDGLSFSCTRIDCRAQDGGTRRRRDVAQQDSDSCTPGSVFERGCNVCRCNDDGKHATCTTKNCTKPSDEESHLPESDLSFRCYPGEQFKRSCNDCTCSADGKSVFCTLRICEKDASGNF